MADMKVGIIGGGSLLWTFGFARQFVHSQNLRGTQLVLMDINAERLELVGRACTLLNDHFGRPIDLRLTDSYEEAMKGADHVVVALSTGGLKTMRNDVEIPEKYGILHTVGDTVGPGGWSRAVRNIPVFYDLAEMMSRWCPRAWMINVSNPLTPLTRVPWKYFGIKSLGMCPGVEEQTRMFSVLAGAKPEARRDYVAAGVDHGSFILKLYADGVDVLEKLKDMGYWRSDDRLPGEVVTQDPMAEAAGNRGVLALWREFGYLAGVSDRHTCENWPFFVAGQKLPLPYGVKRTSIDERQTGYDRMRKRLEDFIANPKPEMLGKQGHGDDPLVETIESLGGHRLLLVGANYRNIGQLPGAPQDAVVETRCLFDAAGVHPLVSPMPDILKAIVMPVIYRQEAIVDIALKGTFDELVALVASDPLCARMQFTDVRRMMTEILEANGTTVGSRSGKAGRGQPAVTSQEKV